MSERGPSTGLKRRLVEVHRLWVCMWGESGPGTGLNATGEGAQGVVGTPPRREAQAPVAGSN